MSKYRRKGSMMVESSLQKRLREKMSEIGISAHGLEQKAGLKRSAVQNILQGRSQKPSAEILLAITKILGCDITELLGASKNTSHQNLGFIIDTERLSPEVTLQINLYEEAVKVASEIFRKQGSHPSKQKALSFIEEIYNYAIENHLKNVDVRFAQWLANKWWNESHVK